MSLHPNIAVALRALRRNTLQTSLTILGMTIGVAAVLTMIALGTGAEAAIEDQVRAAGMNLIMVTAGNYKPKMDDDFGGAVEPSARTEDGSSDPERVALHTKSRFGQPVSRSATLSGSRFALRPAIWGPRDRAEIRLAF